MSAESIARWNAISLAHTETNPEGDSQRSLKRSRPDNNEEEDESEDNVSLVSRSPSPQRQADPMDVDKYDEYVGGTVRETITVDTKIKSSNKGFLMLAGMGWVEGRPLGLSGDGRVEPVPFYVKNDLTGLGKTTQDVQMIESTVAQRRELDSERQIKETEEQRRTREDTVAKRAALQTEIFTTLRAFYCELCEKQFKNVAQYDEHTNSYAHHHKARFRDMQAAQRATRNSKEEVDKRKEKERKREEKELRKIAKAAGVKMTKPPVALVTTPVALPGSTEGDAKSSSLKKSGWASMSSASTSMVVDPPAPITPGSTNPSWAAVGAAPSNLSAIPPGGGWASASTPSQPVPANTAAGHPIGPYSSAAPAPTFRTGGWTSLDTGSTQPPPPTASLPPPLASTSPPPPSARPPSPPTANLSSSSGGWSSVGLPSAASRPQQSSWQSVASTPPVESTEVRSVPPKAPVRHETSRSGWQQFRAGAPGRRK